MVLSLRTLTMAWEAREPSREGRGVGEIWFLCHQSWQRFQRSSNSTHVSYDNKFRDTKTKMIKSQANWMVEKRLKPSSTNSDILLHCVVCPVFPSLPPPKIKFLWPSETCSQRSWLEFLVLHELSCIIWCNPTVNASQSLMTIRT